VRAGRRRAPRRRGSFPPTIVTRRDRRSAAENRNAAARALDTDDISFIDADDEMHPQRTAIVGDVFAPAGVDLGAASATRGSATAQAAWRALPLSDPRTVLKWRRADDSSEELAEREGVG
jgi:hypothetical protein